MANANNTGTPDAGQPQGNAAGTPNQPKLIAGKYATLEEAVEKGYGGLEQGFNSLSEKVANLTRLLEVAVAPQDPVPTTGPANYSNYGYGNPDPYGRVAGAPPVAGGVQNPAVDFIMNPHAELDKREQRLLGQIGNLVTNTVTNAMAVADFKLRHPDLVKHEPLVRTFMNQTDARKPVAERLEDAAKAARAYIAQNFQQPANTPPAGPNYVEPPRGPVTMLPPGAPPPAPSADDGEQELVDYLNQRNSDKALQMGVGYEPQK